MTTKQLGLFDAPVEEKPKPTFCCLDFETGGLDPEECGLCSVAIVIADQYLNEFFRFYFVLYEPDKRYEAAALRVNGFTVEQLQKEGMQPSSFIPALHQLIDKYIMVNHNSAFDVAFLNKRGWNIQKSVDTMVNDAVITPASKHKLGMVYNRLFGHDFEGAHNALADVEAMIEVLRWQMKKDPKYGIPQKIEWNRYKK